MMTISSETCIFTHKPLPNPHFQRDVISCLEFGVVSKCARICVQALSVCMLEMQEVMMRQLPSVLVRLSQISATSAMAIPLMEFLSSMSSLDSRPRVSFTSVALFMQHFITCFFKINLILVCIYYHVDFIILNIMNFNLYVLINFTSYNI